MIYLNWLSRNWGRCLGVKRQAVKPQFEAKDLIFKTKTRNELIACGQNLNGCTVTLPPFVPARKKLWELSKCHPLGQDCIACEDWKLTEDGSGTVIFKRSFVRHSCRIASGSCRKLLFWRDHWQRSIFCNMNRQLDIFSLLASCPLIMTIPGLIDFAPLSKQKLQGKNLWGMFRVTSNITFSILNAACCQLCRGHYLQDGFLWFLRGIACSTLQWHRQAKSFPPTSHLHLSSQAHWSADSCRRNWCLTRSLERQDFANLQAWSMKTYRLALYMQADRDIVCPSKHQWKRRCLSSRSIRAARSIAQLMDSTVQAPLLSATLHQALHRCRICQYFSCGPWNFKPQGTKIWGTISGTMGNLLFDLYLGISCISSRGISMHLNFTSFHKNRAELSAKERFQILSNSKPSRGLSASRLVNRLLQDLSSLPVPPEPETGAFQVISSNNFTAFERLDAHKKSQTCFNMSCGKNTYAPLDLAWLNKP